MCQSLSDRVAVTARSIVDEPSASRSYMGAQVITFPTLYKVVQRADTRMSILMSAGPEPQPDARRER